MSGLYLDGLFTSGGEWTFNHGVDPDELNPVRIRLSAPSKLQRALGSFNFSR